jgi:hemerythrin-like domain-containing protein
MQAVKILAEEHAVISEMLDHLADARDMLERRSRPPREFLEIAIAFSRDFVDRFHHFKEEFLLFGLLAQKKDGVLDAEIGALRYEHESGRKLINHIEAAIVGYAQGDEIATARLLENLAAYVSILKRHIYSEDHVFFKMVEQEFTETEDYALIEQFKKDEQRFEERDFISHSRERVFEMGKLIGQSR